MNLFFPPVVSGGYELECRQVADALAARGHAVSVLTSDHESAAVEECVPYPVFRRLRQFWPLDRPVRGAQRWRRLTTCWHNRRVTQRVIEDTRPDVVFLWSQLRIGMGAARAASRAGVPYAWRIGDEFLAGFRPAPLAFSPRGVYRYVCDAWLFADGTYRGLDFRAVSSITRAVTRSLLEQDVPLERAVVIPKGIPLERFPPREDREAHGATRVLYAGRLHPEKGVHTLIEAAHRVSRDPGRPPLDVTLVGTGAAEYVARLEALARAGHARISFAGHVDYARMGPVYRAHDLFVFPSIIAEGLGATQQEAMASALPIVSTAHGGQGEFLVDGENGLAFAAGDAAALAAQLERVIRDEALRRRLARGARATAERHFSMDVYAERTEAFLRDAREAWA